MTTEYSSLARSPRVLTNRHKTCSRVPEGPGCLGLPDETLISQQTKLTSDFFHGRHQTLRRTQKPVAPYGGANVADMNTRAQSLGLTDVSGCPTRGVPAGKDWAKSTYRGREDTAPRTSPDPECSYSSCSQCLNTGRNAKQEQRH